MAAVRQLASLALVLGVGCFDPSATMGAACDRTRDCGQGQHCRHGLCGRCGDERRQVGETCFSDATPLGPVGADARMVVADLAGNGRADVVVIDGAGLTWWRRTATVDDTTLTLAEPATALAVGELDGAAPREIVVGGAGGIAVVTVDDTALVLADSLAVGEDVGDVAVLEVDDAAGRIAWTAGGQSGAIAIVDGTGAALGSLAVGPWPRFVTALDHDGDGWRDLAVTVGMPARLWVLRGDPSGLVPGPSVALAAAPVAIAPYDRDRDGHPGFAVLFDDGAIDLVDRTRDGDLVARAAIEAPLALVEPRALAVIDANVDGLLDLLVGGRDELRLLPSEAGAFDFDVVFAARGATALGVASVGPLPIADVFALADGSLVRMEGER